MVAWRRGEDGIIHICVHVRRGDVYYLGPKTRLPHPHWVETTTVLDVLIGARRALNMALELPRVQVNVFSERGWLHNDTQALLAIAPHARIYLDSSPAATIDALIQMARADLLIMGSSGFSFWAGVFGCGVKVGERRAEALPFRHVAYASTITTRAGPFWPAAGRLLRDEWRKYWTCRQDPACRPTLCTTKHLWRGDTTLQRDVWAESPLAKSILDESHSLQWQLPNRVLWPTADDASARGMPKSGSEPTNPYAHMRMMCVATQPTRASKRRGSGRQASGVEPCLRNLWLNNLTTFLAGRKTIPGVCC